jgi:hypothetical protein
MRLLKEKMLYGEQLKKIKDVIGTKATQNIFLITNLINKT